YASFGEEALSRVPSFVGPNLFGYRPWRPNKFGPTTEVLCMKRVRYRAIRTLAAHSVLFRPHPDRCALSRPEAQLVDVGDVPAFDLRQQIQEMMFLLHDEFG